MMESPIFRQPPPSEEVRNQPAQWLTSTRDLINEFLRQKRIAIVGVSGRKHHFSRAVLTEFRKRGYDVVPCNPHESSIDGLEVFPNVQSIKPPVDAVLVMTAPSVSESVVRDCQQAGITRVWLHRGTGTGASSSSAISFCLHHSMKVISGHCPLMFLSDTHLIHRVHGLFKRITGTYPN